MDSLRHNNVKQMGRLQFCFESCEWINMWNDVANWPFSWDNIHFRFTDARGALVQHRCSFTKCSSYGNCSRETTTQKWDRQCDSLIACRANNFHSEKHKFINFLFLISFLRFPICCLVLSSVSHQVQGYSNKWTTWSIDVRPPKSCVASHIAIRHNKILSFL